MDAFEGDGKLHALRVNVSDDIVPHLPPKRVAMALGLMAGVSAVLMLQPWLSSPSLSVRSTIDSEAAVSIPQWNRGLKMSFCIIA